MHDIDRAMFETEQEAEFEVPDAQSEAFEGETYEGETYESLESGYESDSREMELAAELLEVSSEEELEQFLGNLLSSAVSAARGFAGSATGRALGGVLKSAARQALPRSAGCSATSSRRVRAGGWGSKPDGGWAAS